MTGHDWTIVIDRTDEGTRAALLRDREVLSFYFRPTGKHMVSGDLYLGKVRDTRLRQIGWFLDFGEDGSGFLPRQKSLTSTEPDEGAHRIVQIEKEARVGKAAEATEYVQMIGRHIIYLPFGNYTAVSRKIKDETRDALRQLAADWCIPPEGAIVRTSAVSRTSAQLLEEFTALRARWRRICTLAARCAPGLIDRPFSFVGQIINEYPVPPSYTVITNEPDNEENLPSGARVIRKSENDLFSLYKLDESYREALRPLVVLPSGASLVIDYTEALTAIDVNSGPSAFIHDREATARRINEEAADEIGRQLRLREIGGIIVIDFLDLSDERDQRAILARLRSAVADDPATVTIFGYTPLGLVEMTRKRRRYGLRDRALDMHGRQTD